MDGATSVEQSAVTEYMFNPLPVVHLPAFLCLVKLLSGDAALRQQEFRAVVLLRQGEGHL